MNFSNKTCMAFVSKLQCFLLKFTS